MDKMEGAKRLSFRQYSLNGRCANERLVFFEGMKTKRGGSDGG